MKNDKTQSFAGLPVTLVGEMLSKSGQIADEIYAPVCSIQEDRDKLRSQLRDQVGIEKDSQTDGEATPTSCGIDGWSSVKKLLSSNVVYCAVCAVEGLIPPSGKKHWDKPAHEQLIYIEGTGATETGLLDAIMKEMEIEFLTNAPQDVIFLSSSFVTILSAVMENLKPALEFKESATGKEFLNRIKGSILALKSILETSDSEKIRVCVPRKSYNTELAVRMELSNNFNDTVLMTLLLSPGEFTKPANADLSGLEKVRELPIKDQAFATVRDGLVSDLSTMNFLYYRPYTWTPAFRIEILQSAAENSATIMKLLNCIKFQCGIAGIYEPYPLFCAGNMVRSMKKAIPSFRNSALSHITNSNKGDPGELFSLFMIKDSDMEDKNG
ncbi:MAG: DNA double-strand break repair nuclease NurA [Candidatus Latescibacteria bacterium]|nr:DNA double-strand break repair nuclease NurA [Candidatus Latescibacterota bacterium]